MSKQTPFLFAYGRRMRTPRGKFAGAIPANLSLILGSRYVSMWEDGTFRR